MGEGIPPLSNEKSAGETLEKRRKRELGLGILETLIHAFESEKRKPE